jgi:hypothetical protein
MELITNHQRVTYERILPWMREMFGTLVSESADDLSVAVRVGSAVAETHVGPWGHLESTITTRARVVEGAELSSRLLYFLMRKNMEVRFGGFGLDEDGTVVYSHSIVGSTCDRQELQASVNSVVAIADQYDDEIVRMAGGRRAVDGG